MESLDYKVLLDISQTIGRVRDKRDLLQLIVKRFEPLFDFYDCGILLLDKEKRFYYNLLVRDTGIDRAAGNCYLRDLGFYQTRQVKFEKFRL